MLVSMVSANSAMRTRDSMSPVAMRRAQVLRMRRANAAYSEGGLDDRPGAAECQGLVDSGVATRGLFILGAS
jgi:hypothetical protein